MALSHRLDLGGPRLRVRDVLLDGAVPIGCSPFTIGRRETSHLRLGNAEVSRDHADIVLGDGRAALTSAMRLGTGWRFLDIHLDPAFDQIRTAPAFVEWIKPRT